MRWRLTAAVAAVLVLSSCLQREPAGPDIRAGAATLFLRANLAGTVVAIVVVEVTAPDIATPLDFNIPIANGIAAGTVTVPAGSERTIALSAYDAGGLETHSGAVTLNVYRGTNATLSIVLTPFTGDLPITVMLGTLTITVQPTAATLAPGDTLGVRAIVVDANGDSVAGQVGWATFDPSVATVVTTGLQSGRVTAKGEGLTMVVALYDGVGGQATITVTTAPVTGPSATASSLYKIP